MFKQLSNTIFAAVSVLLFLPAASHATGARVASMGTTFAAIADDPSAILYNPAGLTQQNGTNIYGGFSAVVIDSRYESPSSQSEDTDFQVFFPPHLYLSSDIGTKDLRIGLGLYSPFGIGGRKWSDTGLTRYSSTESIIGTFSANPTIAYQVSPSLSVGFGLDYMISQCESKKMVDQSAIGAGDGEITTTNLGGGLGYNAGILFIPDEKFSIGLSYRSGIKVDYDGELRYKNIAPALQPLFGGSQYKTDYTTSLTFPDIWRLGIAYRPTNRLMVAADLIHEKWSSFDKADVNLKNEVPAAGFTDGTTRMDWNDLWGVSVGVEHKATDRLSLRAGYVYEEKYVPDDMVDAGNPDSEKHYANIGFGYRFDRLVVDWFYTLGIFEERSVNNGHLSGKYNTYIHATGISLGYRF